MLPQSNLVFGPYSELVVVGGYGNIDPGPWGVREVESPADIDLQQRPAQASCGPQDPP